jgi:cytochrome c oxidase assembly factor CtaG
MVIACVLALSLAVTAVTSGQGVHTGVIGTVPTTPRWWTLWSVPPVETTGIALVAIYVLRRARAGWPRVSGIAGIVVLLVAVCSPVAGMAHDGLLEVHMLQHTLIGGFGALLVLAALPRATAPVDGVRRLVSHPLVGFPLWIASTAVWLWPAIHDQLLASNSLWILQQVSFFLFGILLWCPILERFAPAPRWFGTGWKCGYMTGVWFFGLMIANIYWFAGSALYPGHAALDAAWGISPLQDQVNAGTVMMGTHCILSFGTIGVLFFASARQQGLEQRLIEAGVDPDEVRDAVRSGQVNALATRSGVTIATRPGID